MRIDSHQHFWNYDPARHAWIDDSMTAIQRDFEPEDLAQLLAPHGIACTVAVQVDQTEAENDYLLNLATQTDLVRAIVGWVDLRAADVADRLDYYSEVDLMKGFRHIVQSEPEDDFMLRPDFLNGISLLEEYGYCYDILIFPNQLKAANALTAKFPNQKFVLDHIAKPYIRDQTLDGWSQEITQLGSRPNVYCKVSGMVTEANWKTWSRDDFYPYLDTVVKAFGIERLMYGSDWPVCTLAANYSQVYELAGGYFEQFSENEQEKFYGDNCAEFYGI